MEESLGGETEGTDRDNRIIGEGLIEITTEIIRKEMETGILEITIMEMIGREEDLEGIEKMGIIEVITIGEDRTEESSGAEAGEGLGIGETEEIEERGTRGAREAIGEEEVVLEGEIGRVLIITETAIIRIDLFKQ